MYSTTTSGDEAEETDASKPAKHDPLAGLSLIDHAEDDEEAGDEAGSSF